MGGLSDFDVRRMNLNLLPALEALLAEGTVAGAARRAHVTPSAMSHSLARLREIFGDPLFVAAGRRLAPTPVAERLARDLPRALDGLGEALRASEPFVPRTSSRLFRLATVDYFELTSLPGLLRRLGREAPGVRIEIERFGPGHMPRLAAGEVDLALVGDAAVPPFAGTRRETLRADGFAVLARRGHPAIGRTLDLATYCALGHVLVSVEGRGAGAVDRALADIGRSRRVALRVPHFVSAPIAVASSDLVTTVGEPIARWAAEQLRVRVLAPPLPLPPIVITAIWPARLDDDPGSRWFRSLFAPSYAANVRTAPAQRRRAP